MIIFRCYFLFLFFPSNNNNNNKRPAATGIIQLRIGTVGFDASERNGFVVVVVAVCFTESTRTRARSRELVCRDET